MSLNKNNFFIYLLFQVFVSLNAQNNTQDSTKVEVLKEVVVTGQYNPQSIKKSVHNVTVIKREQIDQQAANTLADLLNFNLNLTVIPNTQTGRSTISLFGLNAEYFNILVDNIPLVSDNGLGNNIDLTQINLDDVERIEIVEGAMGVEYGANAVTGVINIITKKSGDTKWNITSSIQEETVGNEYALFDEGRHIQALSIGHNINDRWFIKAGANRNHFAGFYNEKQGQAHYINDGLRGLEWLPKKQINTNAFVNHKSKPFNFNYKFDYFNEVIDFYGQTVRPNIDIGSQTSNPSATDRIYTTNRFVNNLNIHGTFNSGINYKASFSYQQQKRDLSEFNYYILTKEKTDIKNETYQSSKVFFSKGSVNNLIKSNKLNAQIGYETRFIKGFDTQASGSYTQQDKEQSQENYAFFASSEYMINNAFSIRPGIRYEYNTKFNSKLIGSLSARYLLAKGYELRANIGSSYRTPNFEELYYYFVDTNHDIRGNENLNPETGFTALINLKKRSWINDFPLINTLKLTYLDVQDKIDLAVVNTSPLQYKYINIDAYKLFGITSENSFRTDRWTFNLGASLQGISRINEEEVNGNDNFLFSYQLNTSGTYHFKKAKLDLTLLFKHQSKQARYVENGSDINGNTLFKKQTTNAYGWLDASVKRRFYKNTITATLGARNLLNVSSVNISNSDSGGIHANGGQSLLLGYGRSFYLKLKYNLNF